MTQQRVKPETLVDYGSTILRALGMPAADAELVLDSLVQSDLWGHQSTACCGCRGMPRGCAAAQ